MTIMNSNERGDSLHSLEQLEQTLLETRVEMKVFETIQYSLDAEWVDHKKVLKAVKDVLGEDAHKNISKQPLAYFEESTAIMFRKKGASLHLSTKAMDEGYYIGLHDREVKLVQDISEMRRAERSIKRKRAAEVRCEEKKKRSKTGKEKSCGPEGEHIKSFTLDECCAIYSDHEFAKEMGVLNKGIDVKLDLHSMRSESVRMVFPLKCWVKTEEMPLSPDEVMKYKSTDISDDESDKEDEQDEMINIDKDKVESCITFKLCRVYRKNKAKSKYEIGTLHSGIEVDFSKEESGGGWIKILSPLQGWVQFIELSQPETAVQEIDKSTKADTVAATTSSAEDSSAKKSIKNSEKEESNSKNSSGRKAIKRRADELVKTTKNKKTNEKSKIDISSGDGGIETEESDQAGAVGTNISTETENNEDFSDDDWNVFDDPDEETLSGKWSCGEKGEYFILEQKDDGILDGYLKDKETCKIDGEVKGECVIFNQKWQKGSVHGIGVVTAVKGKHTDCMRTMNVKFECTNKKGKKVTGENVLYKEPACDLTGIWYAQDEKLGLFGFKVSGRGIISGFLDTEECCKLEGRISAHHVEFEQHWQIKSSKKSGLSKKFLITSVEGFVNNNGSKMCLSYSHPLQDGTRETGDVILRKKTALALAGTWVSGDQGGRFVFEVMGGQKFKGYLDTKDTCIFQEGVIDGFTISFRQVWLAGSAHKGAIAHVKGKVNNMFTKLQLTYSCKKGGKAIKGSSVLTKVRDDLESKNTVLNNECFSGIHSAFPPNVFKQFEGFKLYGHHSGENRFPIYTRTQKILVLGEADFSFTLAIMRTFKRSFSLIVGTSYMRKWGYGKPPPSWNSDPRKRQFLNESIRKLDPTLDEILERGGFCRFGVDARNLEATLFNKEHIGKWSGKFSKTLFDRVIFPFPRASLSRFDRVDDTDLMRGTFRSAQKLLNPGGELHVIMHTSRQGVAQFDLWNIRDLAEEENLVWRAALPFDPKKMPAYNPKDVTGTPWRPFEPRIHVFTPKHSDWRPESRSWRH